MILVFDTTALSRLLSGDDQIMQLAGQPMYNQYVIPFATEAELKFGFINGSKTVQNTKNYASFKERFGATVFYPNEDTSLVYAEFATWAKQHGIALSNNDIWIAATCNQIGGRLLTLDGDFKHLPQVTLVTV